MWRDDACLLDILIYARQAQAMSVGVTWEEFSRDNVRQLASQHALQIIGEAAAKISPGFKTAHPEIPWDKIIGLRHRIVHDYPRIELPKICAILGSQVAELITNVEPLVPPDNS